MNTGTRKLEPNGAPPVVVRFELICVLLLSFKRKPLGEFQGAACRCSLSSPRHPLFYERRLPVTAEIGSVGPMRFETWQANTMHLVFKQPCQIAWHFVMRDENSILVRDRDQTTVEKPVDGTR